MSQATILPLLPFSPALRVVPSDPCLPPGQATQEVVEVNGPVLCSHETPDAALACAGRRGSSTRTFLRLRPEPCCSACKRPW